MMTSNPLERSDVPGIVFNSKDLVTEILFYLTDSPNDILSLAALCKTVESATLDSSQLWRETCRIRWYQKWGFKERWDCAERESQNTGRWWRERYILEELDSKRDSIKPVELCSFVWDMRFWLGERLGNMVRSGLRWTASRELHFGLLQDEAVSNSENFRILHGMVYGHPSERTDLEWFLDDDGNGVQWGRLPLLWPKAEIRRLKNWGWEIRNPNVCLRAIDSGNNLDEEMWEDYLRSMKRYEGAIFPETEIILELPAEFFAFAQNMSRFPYFREVVE